jgi:hypothetical protein
VAVVDHADWETPKSTESSFPTTMQDQYASFLRSARHEYPEICDIVPLNKVYFT